MIKPTKQTRAKKVSFIELYKANQQSLEQLDDKKLLQDSTKHEGDEHVKYLNDKGW